MYFVPNICADVKVYSCPLKTIFVLENTSHIHLWSIQTELERTGNGTGPGQLVYRILCAQFTLQRERDRDRELNHWVSDPFFGTYVVTCRCVATGKFNFSWFIYCVLHIMRIRSSANMAPSIRKVQTKRRKQQIAKRNVRIFALYIMWHLNQIHRDLWVHPLNTERGGKGEFYTHYAIIAISLNVSFNCIGCQLLNSMNYCLRLVRI